MAERLRARGRGAERLHYRIPVYLACIALPLASCARPAYVMPEGSEPPMLISSPPLAYPPGLSEAGVTGTVVLEAMVDTAGQVEPGSIQVVRSSRTAFERPAIEMLRNSRFRPGRSGSEPIRMQVRLPIKFALGRRTVSQADSIAAVARVAAGDRLASAGRIHDAMSEYASAQALDSRLASSAPFWYGLCWHGSLWGFAGDVMSACDQAVELGVDRGAMHDARGIARVLAGDFAGAIADFQLFVRLTTNEQDRLQRARWIQQLRVGQNPLTPEVLQSLRGK